MNGQGVTGVLEPAAGGHRGFFGGGAARGPRGTCGLDGLPGVAHLLNRRRNRAGGARQDEGAEKSRTHETPATASRNRERCLHRRSPATVPVPGIDPSTSRASPTLILRF
jgi:hypothetical protein